MRSNFAIFEVCLSVTSKLDFSRVRCIFNGWLGTDCEAMFDVVSMDLNGYCRMAYVLCNTMLKFQGVGFSIIYGSLTRMYRRGNLAVE